MAKKLVYTTNTPTAGTNYAAADGTWKTIPGGGGGSGTVTSVALTTPAAFNVTGSPITTSGTIALSGAGTASQYVKGDGTLATFPTIPSVTPSALTKTDDTNVTLTLGGSPSNALLQAVSLTVGWTGTLADSRIASASTWNAKQNAITLTTTGTSGAATLVGSTLNIPQYAGAGSGTSFIVGLNATTVVAAATTNYTALTGGGYVNAANEFQRILSLPQTCSLSRWYVRTSATQPASGSLVITLRQNQVDTALAITIAAGSVAGTYSNTATSIAFSAGDLASVKVQNNAAANSTPVISLSIMVTI